MKICTNREVNNLRREVKEILDLDLPKSFNRYLIAEDVEIEIINGESYYLRCTVKGTNFLLDLELKETLVLEESYFKSSLREILKVVGSNNLKALYINGLITLSEWEKFKD